MKANQNITKIEPCDSEESKTSLKGSNHTHQLFDNKDNRNQFSYNNEVSFIVIVFHETQIL